MASSMPCPVVRWDCPVSGGPFPDPRRSVNLAGMKKPGLKAAVGLLVAAGIAAVVTPPTAVANPTAPSVVLAATNSHVPKECLAIKHPKVGRICGHTRILIVRYRAETDCQIKANYPVNPGGKNDWTEWTIPAGKEIGWRFNVNDHVAEIWDPARVGSGKPHWGFVTNRKCIGKSTTDNQSAYWTYEKNKKWKRHPISYPAGRPVPKHIMLAGRSQKPENHYWNKVDWNKRYGAIPATAIKLGQDRTLRDRPNEFVVGNVKAGWQVRPTNEKKAGYTKVYVPSLDLWGWLEL